MTTLYLIRHAEAEGNLYRRAQGHFNSTITDRGYLQLGALSRRFRDVPVDAVYASDLYRAQTTAQAVARPHGLSVQTTPLLREVGIGVWENHTWAWLGYAEREKLVQFNTYPKEWHVEGSEDIRAVIGRMRRAVQQAVEAYPDGTVAMVSHGMALRLLIASLQGLNDEEYNASGHAENTAVTRVEAENGTYRVLYRDDDSHLPDELTSLRKQSWWQYAGGLEQGGIHYEEAGENAYDVCRDAEKIGHLRFHREGSAGVIDEYFLLPQERGKGYGVQPIGQVLTCCRPFGCDTLRVTVPKDNPLAEKRFRSYGFAPCGETADGTVLEIYFGYAEEHREKKLREVIK